MSAATTLRSIRLWWCARKCRPSTPLENKSESTLAAGSFNAEDEGKDELTGTTAMVGWRCLVCDPDEVEADFPELPSEH